MLEIEGISKKGTRESNEDFIGMAKREKTWCFALADGLGGEGRGELASATAVKAVLEHFSKSGELSEECMGQCFWTAQDRIREIQRELNSPYGIKTTLVLLFTDGERALWGHSGDSRVYRIRKCGEIYHTRDHSVPQMLVALGEIEESEIRGHADRNRLLRALGIEWDTPGYTISEETDVEDGDVFLLCSDGLWERVEEEQMFRMLQEAESMAEWMEMLENYLLRQGKDQDMDNYSAIVIAKGGNENGSCTMSEGAFL